MLTKELFYQYRETAPLTTGQDLRLFEQSLRTVAIPTPTAKQSNNSQNKPRKLTHCTYWNGKKRYKRQRNGSQKAKLYRTTNRLQVQIIWLTV